MPNNVRQRIIFSAKEAERVFGKIIREGEVDFNTLIPQPAHIYKGGLGSLHDKLYPHDNWRDWSVSNWGTKWNAYDTHTTIIGEPKVEGSKAVLEFQTAWDYSRPFVTAFANTFKIPFTLKVDGEIDSLIHETWTIKDSITGQVLETPQLTTHTHSQVPGSDALEDFKDRTGLQELPDEDYVFICLKDTNTVIGVGYTLLSSGKEDRVVIHLKPEQFRGTFKIVGDDSKDAKISDEQNDNMGMAKFRDSELDCFNTFVWKRLKLKDTEKDFHFFGLFGSFQPGSQNRPEQLIRICINVEDVDIYTTNGLQQTLKEDETTSSSPLILTLRIFPDMDIPDFFKDTASKLKMLEVALGDSTKQDVLCGSTTAPKWKDMMLLNPYYKDPNYGWWIPFFCAFYGAPSFVNIDVK